jgi:uncharacterized membrane protein
MSPSIFGQWMLYLPGAIEGLAAVLIGLASLETAIRIAELFIRRRVTGAAKEEIRLRLGVWLSLALELEIAADILRTTITPSWNEIGKLAAVFALRTVLNYFLQMEISRAALSDSDVTQPPAGAGRRVAGKSTESRDVSERVRLETLCKRDGMEAAQQWARWAAALYRRSMYEPTHYASQPDKKPLFERSESELQRFADTGAVA